MTGFASRTGGEAEYSWVIELRSVNAKGLDLRFRLPEQLASLDPVLRSDLQKRIARGSVNLSIKLERGEGQVALTLDQTALASVLDAARVAASEAAARGLEMQATTAGELLAIPGVMRRQEGDEADAPLAAIKADIDACLAEFLAARASEGASLKAVLTRQLDEIGALTGEAAEVAEARRPKMEATLKENLTRIASTVGEVEPDRIAQELALLAVKADVTEEIDRLEAHVTAGRALLEDEGPVGRRLDFLMQEFNREANTLCSKAGDSDLTKLGLELKALIEQMREQVQNLE